MPEPSPGTPTPNERFDALWEEVGAKRVTLGTEEKGVTITVDADLSIFALLDKLKETARKKEEAGEITKEEAKSVIHSSETVLSKLSSEIGGSVHDKLQSLLGKKKH